MKVLVVGSGGREHAICWKLKQSPRVTELYCAPGNAGIGKDAECVPVSAEDIPGIVALAQEKAIDLAVIGPEVPLAMGIVDALEAVGVKTFGPNKKCSQLEASKAFTKSFLARHDIPTAKYKEYTDKQALIDDIGIFGWPMVIKADGLAAGKGVVLAENAVEAEAAIEDMMGSRVFGEAGDKIVVEECLRGVEASMLCFVDTNTIVPMEPAQDYKRILDGDRGPNTGGMGSYSPSLVFNDALMEQLRKEILEPTLAGFQADGLDFRGVLFIGLMIGKDGPKVIEFNNRFGDPETQSVLMRLDTDLLDVFEAVCDDRLAEMGFGVYEGVRDSFNIPDSDCPVNVLFKEPEKYVEPVEGGESLEELFDRTGQFLEEKVFPLVKSGKDVIIVGHGAMNSSIICRVMNKDIKDFWSAGIENCKLMRLI